jgi:dihydroorotase
LTDETLQSFSTSLKMNPPLRSQKHRDAIVDGIADGTVDAIATDHAPHHFDEKNVEFDLAPFGVIGLETAFAVCYSQLVAKKVIDLERLVDLLSCGPARIFNLPGGTLKSGAIGDVTILDPAAKSTVATPFLSMAQNSPFIGQTLQGRVIATVVGGVVKHDSRLPVVKKKAKQRS